MSALPPISRHCSAPLACLVSANRRHMQCNKMTHCTVTRSPRRRVGGISRLRGKERERKSASALKSEFALRPAPPFARRHVGAGKDSRHDPARGHQQHAIVRRRVLIILGLAAASCSISTAAGMCRARRRSMVISPGASLRRRARPHRYPRSSACARAPVSGRARRCRHGLPGALGRWCRSAENGGARRVLRRRTRLGDAAQAA